MSNYKIHVRQVFMFVDLLMCLLTLTFLPSLMMLTNMLRTVFILGVKHHAVTCNDMFLMLLFFVPVLLMPGVLQLLRNGTLTDTQMFKADEQTAGTE